MTTPNNDANRETPVHPPRYRPRQSTAIWNRHPRFWRGDYRIGRRLGLSRRRALTDLVLGRIW